jgi:ParB/RepB/Spo0J family partition protein
MLTELMESIREHGIIQPLIVRRVNGKLELIAGERRFRASRELGLKEIPVIVREASDKDVLEMALIENLQREGLNPIEEAQAYSRLAKDFHMRQEDIAQRVGKNRATVANTMRLLELPGSIRDMLATTKISTGHAKVLLMLKSTTSRSAWPSRSSPRASPSAPRKKRSMPSCIRHHRPSRSRRKRNWFVPSRRWSRSSSSTSPRTSAFITPRKKAASRSTTTASKT